MNTSRDVSLRKTCIVDYTKQTYRQIPFSSYKATRRTSSQRPHRCTTRALNLNFFFVIIGVLLLSHMAVAYPQLDRRKTEAALSMPLVIDRSVPPLPRSAAMPMTDKDFEVLFLERRQDYNGNDLTPRNPQILTDQSGPSNTTPQPFDANMGNNFTQPQCHTFFDNMLKDPDFESCHPISLLLQTSNTFFQATKSLARLTQVLEQSCSVDLDKCTSLMAGYANDIISDSNCGADYQLLNPAITQAHNGLLAYVPIYQATCMKDNSTNNYCYADAVTNIANPTSSYVYYLPLGVPLPSGAMPSCDDCMKQTMAGFATFATNATQPISRTYPNAAQQVDIICGPTFAQKNIVITSGASAAGLSSSWLLGVVALAAWWLGTP